MGPYFECDMRKYVKSVCEEFETHTGKRLKDYATPGAPGTMLLKNQGEMVDQSGYRKFVGKSLFAVKKLLPDCSNAVRDLSVHLENPGKDAWKAVGRMFGHLKHRYRPLKLRMPQDMRTRTHVDSDWATDKNDRKSITAYLTTIGKTCLVQWQSKKQKTVALSSTEAELYAESNASQDMVFENNMLEEVLGREPELPSVLYGDNMGAIFLAANLAISQRTKHVDIRTRFITDLVEAQLVKMAKVDSEENPADAISKNSKEALHVKHAEAMYNGTLHSPSREGVARAVRAVWCSDGKSGGKVGTPMGKGG
jgi:hypothetical protein